LVRPGTKDALFRFCVVYFTLYALATQIIGGVILTPWFSFPALGNVRPTRAITEWLAEHVFDLRPPLVFIGNNRYEMSLLALGKRETLDGGALWLYVANDRGRTGLVSLALRTAIGRLDQARDFVGMAVPELTIEDRRRKIAIAFDGEVCEVDSPLRCAIRPRALSVLVPAPEPLK